MGVKTRNLGNSEGKDIQWQAPLNADGSTIFELEAKDTLLTQLVVKLN